MGGYGSGRSGGRPTVEDGLTLDLYKLLRDGLIHKGPWGGTLRWTETRSGRHIASVGYQGHVGVDEGRLRLTYTTTRSYDGTTHNSDYWITLTSTPQPLGGRRWWFICPRTAKLVSKLHLPPGAFTFASRDAYRLGYRSQRETRRDRSLNRAFKLRRRLGSNGGIGEYIVKPKGMRWRTFERNMDRIRSAENIVAAHSWLLLQSLNKRLRR